MIVQTKYRDIPYSELQSIHPWLDESRRDEWENTARNKPIQILVPSIGLIPDRCNTVFYEVYPRKMTETGKIGSVCCHSTEIGD